jgi:hypothetical protein
VTINESSCSKEIATRINQVEKCDERTAVQSRTSDSHLVMDSLEVSALLVDLQTRSIRFEFAESI